MKIITWEVPSKSTLRVVSNRSVLAILVRISVEFTPNSQWQNRFERCDFYDILR